MTRWILPCLQICLLLWLAAGCTNEAEKEKTSGQPEESSPETTPEKAEFDLDNLPDFPVVLMKTSLGDITMQFDNTRAPITTRNFLQYAQAGFYDGTIFHRVISNFMIQGGGFTEDYYKVPGARPKTPRAAIKNESGNGLVNERGTLSMGLKSNQPDSATSQFFINLKHNAHLDSGFAVFGKVTGGMDVVDRIASARMSPRQRSLPAEPIVIESVTAVIE